MWRLIFLARLSGNAKLHAGFQSSFVSIRPVELKADWKENEIFHLSDATSSASCQFELLNLNANQPRYMNSVADIYTQRMKYRYFMQPTALKVLHKLGSSLLTFLLRESCCSPRSLPHENNYYCNPETTSLRRRLVRGC